MNYGIGNVKGGKLIANNGAYFVDLTNATESSGTYTIPSADIENGDFTLQVGDTLIDKATGSMLKIATLTPDITATLVYEASSGGGSQKYKHNVVIRCSRSYNKAVCGITIESEDNTPFTRSTIIDYFKNNGYDSTLKAYTLCNGFLITSSSQNAYVVGMYVDGSDRLCISATYDGANIIAPDFAYNYIEIVQDEVK